MVCFGHDPEGNVYPLLKRCDNCRLGVPQSKRDSPLSVSRERCSWPL